MSREAELYKDKIEVSLDGRQIFYLFFGGAVIVGLVFVLGVMVGRRVEARGHTDRARVAATVDPLAALDRLEGGSGLSFQGALRGADGPISDVEKTIAAMPKRDDRPIAKLDKKSDEPSEADEDKQADDDKKVDEAKKADEAKKLAELKKADEAKKADELKKAEAKKADDKKLEAKKADETKKADEAKKTDDHKADKAVVKPADDHKTADKAVADKKDGKTEKIADKATDKTADKATDKTTDKADKPKYTLQVSSFQERPEALAMLATVKAAGYQAYITEGSVDGKQYFRVRTGWFKTMEAATQARTELEKTLKRSTIVIKL